MNQPVVDRCLCHGVSFEELRILSEQDGLDLHGLKQRTGCCTGCTMCEPYVRVMLATGRTRIGLLSPAEVARIMSGTFPP